MDRPPPRPCVLIRARAVVVGLLVSALAVVIGGGLGVSAASAATTAAPTVTLAVSPASSTTYGAPVILTATVSPAPATGAVFFYDGWHQIGASGSLVTNGSAAVTVSSLTPGAHNLSAGFVSNVNGGGEASSATVTHTVVSSTSTTLTASPPDPVVSQAITLTAVVTPTAPGAGVATGSVRFVSDSLGVIATRPLDGSGRAAASWVPPGPGPSNVYATFVPTGNVLLASTSAPTLVRVLLATTTTLTVGPGSLSVPGAPITLTATVSPAKSAFGVVDFYAQGIKVGSAGWTPSLLRVQASFLTYATRHYDFTAVFHSGSAAYAGSTSAVVGHDVKYPTATTLVVTGHSSESFGGQIQLRATVLPALPGTFVVTAHYADGSESQTSEHTATGTADLQVYQYGVAVIITARFVPDDSTAYADSTSPPVTPVS